MFEKPSLVTRIAVGKTLGFIIGLAAFFITPYFYPEATSMLQWGILLWYTTLGAIIGVFGVFSRHPVFKFPMPWWFRATLLGGWMNFVLTLFAYQEFSKMMLAMFGENGLLTSPFWFVAEGAIIGLIIGFLATRFGGEGKSTLDF